jgi:hypothetical protein
MRQARFPASCRRRLLGVIVAGPLAFIGPGCHQHYHYYGSSACGPSTTTLPSSVQTGTICEDGSQVVEGGTKVAGAATISSTVGDTKTKSARVVVSEPRNSWKKSNPDDIVVTGSVEGALGDTTTKQ